MKYALTIFLFIFLTCCSVVEGSGYVIKGNRVIYRSIDTGHGIKEKYVSSDISNFQDFGNKWAKDLSNVYYFGERIDGLDSGTFKVLSDLFVRDQNYIYCGPDRILEASPESFKVLENNQLGATSFGVDESAIFGCTLSAAGYSVTSSESSLDFQVFESGYSRDGIHLYWLMKKIENVDPNSFKHLGGNYALINNNVYYGRTIIENVDIKSFDVKGKFKAADKNADYYFENRKIRLR